MTEPRPALTARHVRPSPAENRQQLVERTHALLLELPKADSSRHYDVVEEIVTSRIWLAESLAHRVTGHPDHREDLAQVACLGLVEACSRFDPDQGVPYGAFASITINGMLRHYLRDHTWTVRPPRAVQELALTLRDQESRLTQQIAGRPTAKQLAGSLNDGTSVEEVRQAQVANKAAHRWLLDDLGSTWVAVDGAVEHSLQASELRILINRLLLDLDPGDRELLRLRFVHEQNQSVIAAQLNVNQMAVSRRLKRLMDRLRDRLTTPDSSNSEARSKPPFTA